MTKEDRNKLLKIENKRLKAQLKRRDDKIARQDDKIARQDARISQLEEEVKKRSFRQTYGAASPDYCKTIPGHQFSEFVVRYALTLRCRTNSSTRNIVRTIEILAELTHDLVDKVPTYNTIDYWVRKCGLDELKHASENLKDKDCAAIIDECMMIGSQKLLAVLAVPAKHKGRPVRLEDVKVAGLNVKPGWTAQTVYDAFQADVERTGMNLRYVISDNDNKIRKAIGMSGHMWHRDISHTLAMFMERVYKNDSEFVDFNDKVAACRSLCCMKETAYLQSPTQRTKARFMNLSDVVEWADSLLQVLHERNAREREVFSFISSYASLIEELKEMTSCVHHIEKEMKFKGLSKSTIAACRKHVCATIMCGSERMRKVGQQIIGYLDEENSLLGDKEVVNNSSDIIESTFGIFKYRQSPNKLNGVTSIVLHLPVIMAFARKSASGNYNVRERLCRTRIKDVARWRKENLLENLVAKRIKTLKSA